MRNARVVLLLLSLGLTGCIIAPDPGYSNRGWGGGYHAEYHADYGEHGRWGPLD